MRSRCRGLPISTSACWIRLRNRSGRSLHPLALSPTTSITPQTVCPEFLPADQECSASNHGPPPSSEECGPSTGGKALGSLASRLSALDMVNSHGAMAAAAMTSLSSKKSSAASISSRDCTLRMKAVWLAGSMAARRLPVVPSAACRALNSAGLGW
jgi:hypothetical protein